jgi:hypothetical protein
MEGGNGSMDDGAMSESGSMDDGAESEDHRTWTYNNTDTRSGAATPTRTLSMSGSPLHDDDFDPAEFAAHHANTEFAYLVNDYLQFDNTDRDSGAATPTRTLSMPGSDRTLSMPGSPLNNDDFDDRPC